MATSDLVRRRQMQRLMHRPAGCSTPRAEVEVDLTFHREARVVFLPEFGGWHLEIGSDLPAYHLRIQRTAVRFCPWCGETLP